MADPKSSRSIDPNTGFCRQTRTFHSLRPFVPLPPPAEPLSVTEYCFALLRTTFLPLDSTPFIIDAATGHRLTYSTFISQTHSLAAHLRTAHSLSRGDTAFVLCPPSLHVPVLYFSLLSLGVVVSPANPLSSDSEVAHQVQLCRPSIAFATSQTAHKIPKLANGVILVDSPEFASILSRKSAIGPGQGFGIDVKQSEPATILYSSGTTGKVKGVMLSHRNVIAVTAGFYHIKVPLKDPDQAPPQPVSVFTVPLFHVFGFFMLVRAAALGETLVLMEKFDFEGMLRAVERYRVTYMPVSPPLVVGFLKSDLVAKYDISSLQLLGCGGAPLGKDVSERFRKKFPNVEIAQGYGMTETGGGATRMIGDDETMQNGSTGRLADNMEAKIVDPESGEALGPDQRGELWLRGPSVMKGYVGDDKATAETLDRDGWLKTGDLCYFDSRGFLYIVDRLKELIKYKAYQVPPAELEHLLQSHPDIADAAVVPYPDEEAGQIPMGYVVRRPGSNITAGQIMDFIAKQVAPYKKIRRLAFVSAIPKNPAGKTLRRELLSLAVPASKL